MNKQKTSPDELEKIPTNLRLLLVLETLCRSGLPATPTDVNAELGLPKPTLHRLFHTLENEGFLQRDADGRSFSPGARLRKLSTDVLSSLRVRAARLVILDALSDVTGETCNIATPDHEAMVFLDRVETDWPLRIHLPEGTKVPFHCTACGKLYLSSFQPAHLRTYLAATQLPPRTKNSITDPDVLAKELADIAKQGYALDNEEFIHGMIALALPIFDSQKRLLATVSVHAPTQRMSLEQLETLVPVVSQSAARLNALFSIDP